MSFNGSGVYSLPGAALATGGTVSATEHNQFRNDVATALNLCVLKDGQQTITANLPMNSKKLTGLAAGTTAGDSVRYEQATSAVAITGGTINGAVVGGVTPAAITGTTITANTGFSGAHNGTVGATTPSTGAFTTLSASGISSLASSVQITGESFPASGVGLELSYSSNTGVLRAYDRSGSAYKAASYRALSHNFQASGTTIADITSTGLAVTGIVVPEADNTRTLGSASKRWSVVYAGTGTINTSDAREKTEVQTLTENEINAAKQLAKEIGSYKWLASVAEKGDAARKHYGLTVQRAIEILEANEINPFECAFICYDKWEDQFIEHPAIEAKDAVLDEEGNEIESAVEAKDAWTEQTQVAGDRYGFRYDQLNLFIAAGFEARLSALENK